ncbi:arginine--tRNA ligase, chloroplastic/mitochondrial [Tanacetum coccineum]
MLNEEGNTFVYLLNTQVQNRSFTKKHRKGIHLLKKEEGVERVLVLHLLKFTQVITMSCYPVLPHKLCKYLYDLSVIFNSYCDSWEVGIAETKLLLCKATEVVMEKCFQLLGITPESSSLGDKQESLGLPRSLLQVGRLNHEDPPKNPNPRFQLFSIYVHIFGDPTLREYMLFGKITISDTYGVLYDGWGLQDAPDRGTVTLFDCDWGDQIRVDNHGKLELGNPSSTHLVPLSSFMDFCTELYATTLKDDALFPLMRIDVQMKFAYFWEMEADTKCDMLPFKGKDGDVRMYYVLLKDAMHCAIENFYTALLYEDRLNSKIAGKVGEDTLKRSMMDVPDKGSIVIKSRLHDYDSKEHGYLDGSCTFDAQPQGVFEEEIRGSCRCCSLSVRVVWSQG